MIGRVRRARRVGLVKSDGGRIEMQRSGLAVVDAKAQASGVDAQAQMGRYFAR
jgi:hypothetical protein